MFTEEKLKESIEFKDWIGKDKVALIHNLYWDSKPSYHSFIVIHAKHKDSDKWNITRFFDMGGKIQVSFDKKDLSTHEIFKKLLTEYSRGLA